MIVLCHVHVCVVTVESVGAGAPVMGMSIDVMVARAARQPILTSSHSVPCRPREFWDCRSSG